MLNSTSGLSFGMGMTGTSEIMNFAKAKAEGKEYNFNPVNAAINIIIGGLFGSIEAIKGNFRPTDIEFQKAVELQKKLQSSDPNAVKDAVAFSNTHSSLLKKFNAEAQSPEARQVNAGVNEWNSAETTLSKDLPKWPETFEELLSLPEKPQATPGELPDLASNGLMGYNEGVGKIIFTSLDEYVNNPKNFGQATPEQLYKQLQDNGLKPSPLSGGNTKGISFEHGGGFKVNWGGDRILQYHPAGLNHHGGGAYYKVSSGPTGTLRFDLLGNPLPPIRTK